MINEILHVRARCGGGKSRETIKELIGHLLSQPSIRDIYLFASKTNHLTSQNHEFVGQVVQNHPNGKDLSIQKIDSTSNKGTVTKDLAGLLATDFKGVIFISHSALALISANQLEGVRIVVDEVPTVLVNYLVVTHDVQDHGYPWEKYLVNVPSSHPNYMRVRLNPNADIDNVQRYINAIKKKEDTTTTANVAQLLEFLLADYEALYTISKNSNGSIIKFYQAIDYDRLRGIMKHASFLAILSAQLKDTLVGYIAKHHLDIPITEKDISDKVTLVQRHKNRALIIPFLKEGRWSTTLRKKAVNDALSRDKEPVESNIPVRVFAQQFAAKILDQKDFMITLNVNDKLIDSFDRQGVSRTATEVQGMNNLNHLDHAVYLASTNPKPIEKNALSLFAKDNKLNQDEIIHAVMVEQCYEKAYQCVARTSIRNDYLNQDKEHIIIVPDMHYAEYIATWFEPGCATVDTQWSYSTKNRGKQSIKDDYYRLKIIQILTERSLKKGKLKDLLHSFGIPLSTFKRYKERFRLELEKAKLLKPKRTNKAVE
jgi:hypothetical protein